MSAETVRREGHQPGEQFRPERGELPESGVVPDEPLEVAEERAPEREARTPTTAIEM